MRNSTFGRTVAAAGLGLLTLGGVGRAQVAPAARPAANQTDNRPTKHAQGDLPGPIDNLQDLEDTGKLLFKLTDTNNDGQLSKKEVTDAGDIVVGGFFFKADVNGDGAVSADEMREVRDEIFQQQPLLRIVLERAGSEVKSNQPRDSSAAPTSRAAENLLTLLDTNHDQKLEAKELRQVVKNTVNSVFNTADTNHDDQLSPTEINAAMIGFVRAVGEGMFQTTDTDGNGAVSKAEFDKAIVKQANVMFSVIDANGDGQITQPEAQAAFRTIYDQVRRLSVPEPSNSLRNIIQSGQSPAQQSAIPRVTLPRLNPGQNASPAGANPAPATQPR